MPGKVKVKILAGRNLPVMDRSSDTTDAYVEIKLGNTTYKTDVCRKSLNPQWNSEWYRYEVDDLELQDEPLQIRLMDHDTYSANDAIGKVYLDLNPLLLPASPAPVKSSWNSENSTTSSASLTGGSAMSGWIPVFDTMHGIRGEVNIIVKVELFSDFNKFRQSSCGVQLFCSPVIPQGYHAQVVHGFVEELVVNDDPEYQWIDKIRTPRASNEARQTLFFKLSGEVQRKIGLKALDLGGNAVIGYSQCFDLEGESGIVVRGIGTAVTLTKLQEISAQPPLPLDITAVDDGMVSASVVDDRCFVESSESGLLQPLELCVPPPSPKLCVTPPTPNILSPTSPLLCKELCQESLSPTTVGPGFSGIAKLKPKKKKARHPVLVVPRYLAASSKVDHSLTHHHLTTRPDYGRHFSQPAVDLRSIASSYKKMGRSTQSLTSTLEESSFRNLLQQEDMRAEAQHGSRISRGLRAIRLFPQNKLSKKLIALKTRLQSESSVDEELPELNNVDTGVGRIRTSCTKKARVKVERRHSRSSSDSVATAIIRSLMDSNVTGLDRVVEVRESPGSSPSSPSRRESYTNIELAKHASGLHGKISEFDSSPIDGGPSDVHITVSESFLRLPSNDDGPELRYVDGHLISNTSSNVSSTSDSSTSEEDASEDYSLDVPIMDKPLSHHPVTSPAVTSELNVMSTVTEHTDHDNNGECNLSLVDGNDAGVTPISNPPVIELTTADSPQAVSTPVCTAGSEQRSDCCFGESETGLNLYQQQIPATHSSSFVKNVNLTSALTETGNVNSASVQRNTGLENVPSFGNRTADTRTDFAQNYSSSIPINDSGKMQVPVSTAGDNMPLKVSTSNCNLTPFMHTEEMSHTKEHIDLQDSGVNINHLSDASVSGCTTRIIQESTSAFKETLQMLEVSSLSIVPSLPQNETASIATPNPGITPDVLPNQENVTYISAPVEDGSNNGLSAGNSVCVSPVVKADSNNSACALDVVLDVGGSCKTNSVTCMQNSPVGKVSVIGMLNIPTSPLHKSQSATTLCSCPTAIIKHDTNDEQASSCCGGDLQFHNIKHGPCFIPPSRQQQLFSGGEEDKQLAGSPLQTGPVSAAGSKISPSPAKLSTMPGIHRRSSDSDLSITPKGNSLTGSDRSSTMGGHIRQGPSVVRPTMNQESLDMLEYPFLTMSKYPLGFILHLGGTVSSRSVKLLERITNLEEPETRDAWWTEIRMEVRSHARALGCNVVLGYSENTSICDDVCVLSASGTAAVINQQFSTATEQDTSGQHPMSRTHLHNKELMTTSLDRTDFERDKTTPQKGDFTLPFTVGTKVRHLSDGYELDSVSACSVCHIPYSECSVPFRVTMLKCAICRHGKVPDVLLTTVELPEGVPTTGKGCFLQAYVCRPKRDCRGELNAKEISDGLPFLEYELHRILINKLKVKGMNSIFGLKVQVSIGERMLVGLATGTAVFLTPLPMPPVPKVSAGNSWDDDKKLAEIQKLLQDTVKKNREIYQLKPILELEFQSNGKIAASDTEESDDELPELDLATGNKDTCVLEVDDAEDVDVISLLIDPCPPEGFYVVNTETVPGLDDQEIVRNLQMFTQVWRAKIPAGQPTSAFSQHFHRLLQSVYFKLRRMVPCALCSLQFSTEVPEPDEMQISVLGMALGLGEPEKPSNKFKKKVIVPSAGKEASKKTDDCELIFSLDEDHVVTENSAVAPIQMQFNRPRPCSPLKIRTPQSKPHHTPPRERYGVDMTPLSYVPGGKIERYLGNLNFFFIRESTCIREGGGLSGFVHSFVTEVLAIVRAHVTALGGNAMVAYFMSECVLYHNPHKNQEPGLSHLLVVNTILDNDMLFCSMDLQRTLSLNTGQCLINVGGDVVFVSYYSEE